MRRVSDPTPPEEVMLERFLSELVDVANDELAAAIQRAFSNTFRYSLVGAEQRVR